MEKALGKNDQPKRGPHEQCDLRRENQGSPKDGNEKEGTSTRANDTKISSAWRRRTSTGRKGATAIVCAGRREICQNENE